MNDLLNNYKYIREKFNGILNNKNINNIKYYITYLYVIKEHPEVIDQYKDCFLNKNEIIKSRLKKNIFLSKIFL